MKGANAAPFLFVLIDGGVMKIAIVGGGLSLRDIDLSTIKPRHDLTIAINSTAWLMDCDVCFTLSSRFANRVNYGQGAPFRFVLAVRERHAGDYPCETLEVLEGGLPNTWPTVAKQPCFVDGGKEGLSELDGVVHGGNSAYSAFNWACLLGAKEISLFGIDGTDRVRVNGRSGNHAHLPLLFASTVPQIKKAGVSVVNYSPASLVDCFVKSGWA